MAEKPFQLLIDLVSFDQNIRTQQKELETVQDGIAALEQQQNQLDQVLQTAKNALHNARKKVDEFELEMKDLDAQERKKKEQLEHVEGYKEYQSTKNEIETLHAKQLAKEQEVLSAWNVLEHAERKLAEVQKEYDQKVAEVEKALEEKRAELAQKKEALKQELAQRPEKEKKVPEEWLEKYNVMKARVPDPVVPVTQASCGACFFMITSQDLLRLRRGALLQCKGCFRLLYDPAIMETQSQEKELE